MAGDQRICQGLRREDFRQLRRSDRIADRAAADESCSAAPILCEIFRDLDQDT